MPRKNSDHKALSDYDTINNIAKTYQKKVRHIAAIMQKKEIKSLGIKYDEISQYDFPLSGEVTPTNHIQIPFNQWKDFQFKEHEGFLFGVSGYHTQMGTQEFETGYKDIYIHKEQFRKKSSFIKTKTRTHEHIAILENIYLELRKRRGQFKPQEFIEYIKEFSGIGICEAIIDFDIRDEKETVTIALSEDRIKDITIGAIRHRVSLFNNKYSKIKKKL